jgi:hypothetical protein
MALCACISADWRNVMESTWLCESIRVSALWRTTEDVSGLLTWQTVVGSEPEQRETQPRFGTMREVGPVWGGVAALELRASPGRADWTLSPIVPLDVHLSAIPNIGSVTDTIPKFRDLIFDQVTGSYPASRFAFGLVALHQQPTVEASYKELAELLRNASLLLSGTSDFNYQINRPRKSKSMEGLPINRVSRWSSMAMHGLQLQVSVPPGSSPDGLISTQSPVLHATRVELDINSSIEWRDAIPAPVRSPLLDELVELAGELLTAGDVP